MANEGCKVKKESSNESEFQSAAVSLSQHAKMLPMRACIPVHCRIPLRPTKRRDRHCSSHHDADVNLKPLYTASA